MEPGGLNCLYRERRFIILMLHYWQSSINNMAVLKFKLSGIENPEVKVSCSKLLQKAIKNLNDESDASFHNDKALSSK